MAEKGVHPYPDLGSFMITIISKKKYRVLLISRLKDEGCRHSCS